MPQSATWDRWLYFPPPPPEGRHAVDFFAWKIWRLWSGSNPRSWVPEASVLTARPPKQLPAQFTHHYVSCTPTGYPAKQTTVCSRFWKHSKFSWTDILPYEVYHFLPVGAQNLGSSHKYAGPPSPSPVCYVFAACLRPATHWYFNLFKTISTSFGLHANNTYQFTFHDTRYSQMKTLKVLQKF
jgi:hypothetical protein